MNNTKAADISMRPTADWRCLANGRVAAQACVRRLWAVAWVVGQFSLVTRERIRGGLSTRCAIQIDVLPYLLPYLMNIESYWV